MKSTIIKHILVITIILCLTSAAIFAQEKTIQGKTILSIETDPSTFVLDGYAFHIRLKPKTSTHWVVGAGTYALTLPDVMVNLNGENKNQGWNVRINSAYSLFGEYYFTRAFKKWFVALQIGIQNYKNTNDNIGGKDSRYGVLVTMPSLGYTWLPFKFPLYIKPWFGVGYATKISGNNSIDNLNYTVSPLIPFATLHVGYIIK